MNQTKCIRHKKKLYTLFPISISLCVFVFFIVLKTYQVVDQFRCVISIESKVIHFDLAVITAIAD